jgi:uncharacterized membrane protein YqjE
MALEPHGLLDSARAVLAALIDVGHTRLQLASTELEEEGLRVAQLLLWAVVAVFLFGVGLVLAAMLAVLLVWDGPREWVLGGITAAFLGGAAASVWVLRRKLRAKPGFMAATIAELKRDQAALGGGPR